MNKSSVYIISTVPLQEGNTAARNRVNKLAKALSKNSNVFLASYYPSFKYDLTPKEFHEGIFYLCGNNIQMINFISVIYRIFQPIFIFYFLKKVLKYSRDTSKRNVFVLYPSTKTSFTWLSILVIKKLYNSILYIDLNEVYQYLVKLDNKNFFTFPLKYLYNRYRKYKFRLLEYSYSHFDGLICISYKIKDYFKKYNINLFLLPILADKGVFTDEKIQPSNYRKDYFKICFTGTISFKKENLDLFIRAIKGLSSKYTLQFDMYGIIEPEEKRNLEKLLSLLTLNNVVFYKGIVNNEILPSILKEYDLLVLPRGYTLQNHYGFSTKLSEYLVSGVPVLVTDVGDNSIYIKDMVNGFVCEADNEDSFYHKIEYVIKNYTFISKEVAARAIETSNRYFYYDNYSESLHKFLFKE